MAKKHKVVLVGPFVGELYWEYFRFAPYVFKQNTRGYDLVVLTRPDRYDIYGDRVKEFVPLSIKGDSTKRFGECFRMMGLDKSDYDQITKTFYDTMSKKYHVVNHYVPSISNPDCLNKDFYPIEKRLFDYKPRLENKELMDDFLKDVRKPIVVLAPRYRKNFKRNWPHWEDFYNKIVETGWDKKVTFIICGKEHEYVPDPLNRFKDINEIKMGNNSSLFGLLLEIMKRAVLTVGSQSAIPNISLMNRVPVVEWGNQRKLHTITYNIHKTPVRFLDSDKFDIDLSKVFNTMIVELCKVI